MESQEVEDNKCIAIRQTIRQVILPLVQAIFLEDPSDVIAFCSKYFETLQKENGDKSDVKKGIGSDEVDKCAPGHTAEAKETDVSRPYVQGSASLPILLSEKSPEVPTLRETSSWNQPPKNSQGGRLRQKLDFNVADATSQIGDQPSSDLGKEEISEGQEISGDAPIVKKNENKDQNENNIKSESENITSDVSKVEHMVSVSNVDKDISHSFTQLSLEHQCDITPSAPPYEEHAKSSIKSVEQQKKKEDFENNNKFDDKVSHFKSEDNAGDIPIQIHDTVCRGQLSPNSSFGFIPQLKEDEATEEMENETSTDNNFKKSNTDEIEKLTKKFSETFEDIAEEFSTAESNFNSKFHEVKEISDVIQPQERTNESPDIKLTSTREEVYTNEDQISLTEKELENKFADDKIRDNEKSGGAYNKTEFEEDQIGLSTDSQVISNCAVLKEVKDSVKEICDTVSKNSIKCELESEITTNTSKKDSQIDTAKSDPDLLKTGVKGNDDRPRSYESWRERWYESHPRLTNVSARTQPRVPRLCRAHPCFFDPRRNQTMHRIGEAGDVPPIRRYHVPDSPAIGTLDCSPESNSETSPLAFETHEGLSAERRAVYSSAERSLPNRTTSNISSQSVPYSWRKMSVKQHTTHSESMEPSSKAPRLITEHDSVHSNRSFRKKSSENLATNDVQEDVKKAESAENDNYSLENKNIRQCELDNPLPAETKEKTLPDNTTKEEVEHNEGNPLQFIIVEDEYFNGADNPTREKSVEDMTGSVCTKDVEADIDNNDKFISSSTEREKYRSSSCQDDLKEKTVDNRNEMHSPDSIKSNDRDIYKETKADDEKPSTEENEGQKESHSGRFDSRKAEPGLNSACGDYAFTNVTADIENDYEPEPRNSGSNDDSSMNASASPESFPNSEEPRITVQYLREVMEGVLQDRKDEMSDEYEGLNFSSISESESSYNENSDLSENDDSNVSIR